MQSFRVTGAGAAQVTFQLGSVPLYATSEAATAGGGPPQIRTSGISEKIGPINNGPRSRSITQPSVKVSFARWPTRGFASRTRINFISALHCPIRDASHWRLFLEAFVRAVHSRGAGLVFRRPWHDIAFQWHGWPDEDIRLYSEQYAATDPWATWNARPPEGAVAKDFEFCPRTTSKSATAFREFYGHRNCVDRMRGIVLLSEAGQSSIAMCRGVGEGLFKNPKKRSCEPSFRICASRGLGSRVRFHEVPLHEIRSRLRAPTKRLGRATGAG